MGSLMDLVAGETREILLAFAVEDEAGLHDRDRFDAHLDLGGGLDPTWLDLFSEAVRSVTGKAPERLNVVGASDARYFARDGVEILVTGPGDGADSHKPNEFVPLEELVDAALIHRAAVERMLG